MWGAPNRRHLLVLGGSNASTTLLSEEVAARLLHGLDVGLELSLVANFEGGDSFIFEVPPCNTDALWSLLVRLVGETFGAGRVGVRRHVCVHQSHLLNSVQNFSVRTVLYLSVMLPFFICHSGQGRLVVNVLGGLLRLDIVGAWYVL